MERSAIAGAFPVLLVAIAVYKSGLGCVLVCGFMGHIRSLTFTNQVWGVLRVCGVSAYTAIAVYKSGIHESYLGCALRLCGVTFKVGCFIIAHPRIQPRMHP